MDGFGEVGYPHADQYRPENFLAIDGHVRSDVVEQRGAKPIAIFQAGFGRREVATVHHQRGASLYTLIDVTGDPLQRCAADNRSHFCLQVAPIGNAQLPCAHG
ncbi:hypothetical protein D3C78_1691510 [compost metagenome]